jgi:hypothetical protein
MAAAEQDLKAVFGHGLGYEIEGREEALLEPEKEWEDVIVAENAGDILQALYCMEFSRPSVIQALAIPVLIRENKEWSRLFWPDEI